MKDVPYASATTGTKAREEISAVLRRFGCESVGFMDEWHEQEVLLAFRHRGRDVQLRASAKGWAQMYLKRHPWTDRMRTSKVDHERKALHQGHIAVNSVLRDWVRGKLAIECGILSFEAVFMPHMLTVDGRPLIERLKDGNLLPQPDAPKVVTLPGRAP